MSESACLSCLLASVYCFSVQMDGDGSRRPGIGGSGALAPIGLARNRRWRNGRGGEYGGTGVRGYLSSVV